MRDQRIELLHVLRLLIALGANGRDRTDYLLITKQPLGHSSFVGMWLAVMDFNHPLQSQNLPSWRLDEPPLVRTVGFEPTAFDLEDRCASACASCGWCLPSESNRVSPT